MTSFFLWCGGRPLVVRAGVRSPLQDPGPDDYDGQASVRRQAAHHVGKLAAPSFEVTLCRLPEPGPDTEPGAKANTPAA